MIAVLSSRGAGQAQQWQRERWSHEGCLPVSKQWPVFVLAFVASGRQPATAHVTMHVTLLLGVFESRHTVRAPDEHTRLTEVSRIQ